MKPEWMPENPYPIEGKMNTIRHFDFKAGCQQTALKLIKWLEQLCITPNHIQCGLRRGCCPECMEQLKEKL